MGISFSHTRLMVENMAASIRFYNEVLGLPIHTRTDGDTYVEFEPLPAVLSLYRREDMSAITATGDLPVRPPSQDTVLLWFQVDSVDALCAELQTKGVTLVVPPTDRPMWGLRTAHFRDPDGNLIEVAHAIAMT